LKITQRFYRYVPNRSNRQLDARPIHASK